MAPKIVCDFSIASEPGNDREAARLAAEAIALYGLSSEQTERLKTAVAEAVLNAMEHGNLYQKQMPVRVVIEAYAESIAISIYDHGRERSVPTTPIEPDLAAKLAGEQRPRGWGLFLIRKMVDDLTIRSEPSQHCVELIFER